MGNTFLKTSVSLFLAALAFAMSGCDEDSASHPTPPRPRVTMPLPKLELKRQFYASCAEMQKEREEQKSQIQAEKAKYLQWLQAVQGSTEGIPLMGSSPNAPQSQASVTNIQEQGIDEADYVKASEDYYFHATSAALQIIDKQSLQVVQSIDLKPNQDFTYLRATLLNQDNKLVLFQSFLNPKDYSFETKISVYSKSQFPAWSLDRQLNLPGNLVSARLKDGQVFALSSQRSFVNYYSTEWIDTARDHLAEKSYHQTQDCRNIVRSAVNDLNPSVSTLAVMDLNSNKSKNSDFITSFVGATDFFYVGQESLYLVNQYVNWLPWDTIPATSDPFQGHLILTRISYNTQKNSIDPISAVLVPGQIRNTWQMKEFSDQKALAIVTSYHNPLNNWQQENSLFVLDYQNFPLKIKAQTEAFGLTEDIRSARFIDDKAYVVTFKKTDPLFAIDLSNLNAPHLIADLKIPGFSTYLHPLKSSNGLGQRLLGVGYDADDQGNFAWFQGQKFSIFELSDKGDLSELTHLNLGGRGSYSPVTDDHHAFYIDQNESIFGLPLMLKSKASLPWEQAPLSQTGFQFFPLFTQAPYLQVTVNVSHKDWIAQDCKDSMNAFYPWWTNSIDYVPYFDVERVIKTDHRLVTFSQYGIQEFDEADVKGSSNLSVLHQTKYTKLPTCSNPYTGTLSLRVNSQ